VPLNTRLTPTELQWQLEHAGCQWLLFNEETAEKRLTINGQQLIVNETWLEPGKFTIRNSQTRPEPAEGFTIDRLQAIVFTSGTSGRPKGVMLTFANHFYSALGSAYRLGALPDDLWLSCLPLYHVGGLAVIFRSCLYGTAVDLHPRFNLEEVNRSLDNKPITLISLVPTMLRRLLQSRDYWPASLRLILLGGAAAPPKLIEEANSLPRSDIHNSQTCPEPAEGFAIHNPSIPLVAPTYGLTEAASQVATMRPEAAAQKPGCVGKPLLFTQVKIVDEAGVERPSGEYGEIVVTGPTVMAGYFNHPAHQTTRLPNYKTTRLPDHQTTRLQDYQTTQLYTGDVGCLDEDGDLWVVQRRTDLIVSGGENIYPAEVEAVLREHTAVTAACVVGIDDPEWGQKAAALIVPQTPGAVTAETLIAWCRERLAGYKIPRLIRFANKLPKTASGKIARQTVKEQLQQWNQP
ncbi:MAG TPA: 2-succinylbenzoate--CoA ligase, partial [Anaerolineae bacterium]|nr:2-succinylbenzoate--CoA ligase [Anaerolineae bacterium]